MATIPNRKRWWILVWTTMLIVGYSAVCLFIGIKKMSVFLIGNGILYLGFGLLWLKSVFMIFYVLLSCSWGSMGIYWYVEDVVPVKEFHLFGIVLNFTIAFICMIRQIFKQINNLTPEDEDAPILKWLRCSCCALRVKKCMVLCPIFALFLWNLILVSYYASKEHCTRSYMLYLGISAGIFLLYFMFGVYLFYVESLRLERNTTCSLTLIVLLCCFSIVWGIIGTLWLQQPYDCPQKAPHFYHQMQWIHYILFSIGGILLFCSLCCRIERIFTETPSEHMYSPRNLAVTV